MEEVIRTAVPAEPLPIQLPLAGPLATEDALRLVESLAAKIAQLHDGGRLHLAIGLDNLVSNKSGEISLSEPPDSVTFSDDDLWPPELKEFPGLKVSTDLLEARRKFREKGVICDPTRVDVYQLGCVLIQLLTGESSGLYLRSPRVFGAVPASLRSLVNRALGYQDEAFADIWEFQTACHGIRAAGLTSDLQDARSAEGDTTPSIVAGKSDPDTVSELRGNRRGNDSGEVLPFRHLGHYVIQKKIGQGGMGDVYLGYEPALDRPVAIKMLASELAKDEEFVRRFRAEATAVARLTHPNIVQIHFIGEEQGCHYFAMQFVEGESLAELLHRRKRLAIDEAIETVEQVLAGLEAAHQRGIVHRDIKPGNILLDLQNRRALVADFGLVKLLERETRNTATGVVMGTVDYISPEQARGLAVDKRSDLYSLGALFFQLLSGRLPFQADSATALIFQHVYEAPPQLSQFVPGIPNAIAAVITKLLAKSPADRYATAAEVLADLKAFQKGLPLPSGADAPTLERKTAIVAAPRFDDEEFLLQESTEAPSDSWWLRIRQRVELLWQKNTPQFVKRLQTTQQHIDGAVAEYERRRNQLRQLVGEAEGVAGELERLLESWRQSDSDSAVQRSGVSAVASSDARGDDQREQEIGELQQQLEQQHEQLASMRLNLAKVEARLQQLRSQRDALNARLKMAQAQIKFVASEAGSPRRAVSLSRVLRRVLAWPLALGLTVCAGILLWQRVPFWWSSDLTDVGPMIVPMENQITGGKKNDDASETIGRPEPPILQLAGHRKEVRAVGFAPRGNMMASGSLDGTMRLWDGSSGALLHDLKASNEGVFALAFSPDGRYVASGGRGRSASEAVKIWTTDTASPTKPLEGEAIDVEQLGFDTAGKIVMAFDRRASRVRAWEVATGQPLTSFDVTKNARIVAFHPSGIIAELGTDSQIRLWDLTGTQTTQFGPFKNTISMAISPDGEMLASGDGVGQVLLWKLSVGSNTQRLDGAQGPISALTYSPDGRRLAAATDTAVYIWDISLGRLAKVVAGTGINRLAFSANSRRLVGGGSQPTVQLWESQLPPVKVVEPVASLEIGTALNLAVASNGRQVVVGGPDVVGVWDFRGTKQLRPFEPVSGRYLCVAISDDGHWAAGGTLEGMASIWDVETGQLHRQVNTRNTISPQQKIDDNRLQVVSLAFSSDGRQLVVGSATTFLWDVWTGSKSYPFRESPIRGLSAVSPDGRYLATGGDWNSDDGTSGVRLWELSTGQYVGQMLGHVHYVWSLAFSSDSKRLLSGGKGHIHLWNVESQSEIMRIQLPSSNPRMTISTLWAETVAFTRDGRRAASAGSGTLSLWDLESGEELMRFSTETEVTERVQKVAFVENDRYLVAAGQDGFVRVWDTAVSKK
jgi:serine/threonine protein kinase/WD40 repeat protein